MGTPREKLVTIAALVLPVVALQCRSNPIVEFGIVVPKSVSAAWYEVAAYPGATCANLLKLGGQGLPVEGQAFHGVWKVGGTPPSLGDLPKRPYAFVGVAKSDTCALVAVGCAEADTSDVRDISVQLSPKSDQQGACGDRETCSYARCVPNVSGAGCTLRTVGEGPLGSVPTLLNQPMASPAIAPVGDHFIVASAEFASDGAPLDAGIGEARTFLTTHVVDNAGGVKLGSQGALGSRCASVPQTDGLGLAFVAGDDGGGGVIMLSRNQCDANAGIDVVSIAGNASFVGSASRFGVAPGRVVVAKAHSTVSRDATRFVSAYSRDTATIVLPMTRVGDALQAETAVGLAPASTVPPLLTANTAQLVVFTHGTTSGSADAGGISGIGVSTTPMTSGTLGNFQNLRALPGNWVNATSRDDRTFAIVGETDKLSVWQIGTSAASDKKIVDLPVDSVPSFADLAVVTSDGDDPVSRLVVAYEVAGGFTLRVVDLASGIEEHSSYYRPSRLLPPKGARDNLFSIAATNNRIGLTWATAAQLGEGEPTGGYAVFSCER